MPTTRRTRTLRASQQQVWELVNDPHHMPRWWPGVTRVESVEEDRFTQVFTTKRGRPVRVDFRVLDSDPSWGCAWEQEIGGTPFERVLNESIIEVGLEPVDGGTEVTISQQQKLRGYSRTGGLMLRHATRSKLDEALDGLERVCG
ncbi:MAG: SRPBCC family protein [Solirubrobacteraceae bacterium]